MSIDSRAWQTYILETELNSAFYESQRTISSLCGEKSTLINYE